MMRVGLGPDGEDERAATARLLSALCPPAELRAAWGDPVGMSRERWRHLAKLGFTGVIVPVAHGGLGRDETALVALMEEAGYVALPEPVVEAAVASSLLAEVAPDPAAGILQGVAAGELVVTSGLPDQPFVNHGTAADAIVLARGGEVHLVSPPPGDLAAQPSVDGARRLYRVDPPATSPLARDRDAVTRAVDRATLLTAAQLLGLGRRCLDLAVDHARHRHQFGRPIGSFQALRHRLADDWTALEFARPVVWRAAWSLAHRVPDATLHVSTAKAAAGEAAMAAATSAMQVHGAMGYTYECDLHLYLKRTLALSLAHGDGRFHRLRLAATLRNRDIHEVP